jgi:hypothetical protein
MGNMVAISNIVAVSSILGLVAGISGLILTCMNSRSNLQGLARGDRLARRSTPTLNRGQKPAARSDRSDQFQSWSP